MRDKILAHIVDCESLSSIKVLFSFFEENDINFDTVMPNSSF
jgi:hypothetical protein